MNKIVKRINLYFCANKNVYRIRYYTVINDFLIYIICLGSPSVFPSHVFVDRGSNKPNPIRDALAGILAEAAA